MGLTLVPELQHAFCLSSCCISILSRPHPIPDFEHPGGLAPAAATHRLGCTSSLKNRAHTGPVSSPSSHPRSALLSLTGSSTGSLIKPAPLALPSPLPSSGCLLAGQHRTQPTASTMPERASPLRKQPLDSPLKSRLSWVFNAPRFQTHSTEQLQPFHPLLLLPGAEIARNSCFQGSPVAWGWGWRLSQI